MRGFFTFILFLLFFLAVPIAVFSYVLNSIIKPDYIKPLLDKSKIYVTTANTLPKLLENPDEETQISLEDSQKLQDFVKNQVTADYIQSKSELMIDKTYRWISGDTDKLPSITFTDLKSELIIVNNNQPLPEELDNFLSKPLQMDSLENISWIRQVYKINQILPQVILVFCSLLLLGIFFLASGWKSKFRDLSLAIFMPAPIGLIFGAAIQCIASLTTGAIKASLEESPYELLIEPLKKLITDISNDVTRPIFIFFGVFLGVSIMLYIISFFVSNKPRIVEDIPEKPTPQTNIPNIPQNPTSLTA